MVSAELKAQVVAKLQECINKIEVRYGIRLPMPNVNYALTGSVAGTACYRHWLISINAGLFVHNVDDYLANTTTHEFAHLATDRIYPEAHESTVIDGKRTKRQPHGPKWREVMAALGVEDSGRCHNYDTTLTQKPKTKYEYVCPRCNKSYIFGPSHHAKQQKHERSYCTPCHASTGKHHFVVLKQTLGRVNYTQAREVASGDREKGPEAKFHLKLQAPKAGTKMADCWKWFQGYAGHYDRQGMISIFVNECGCTWAGAATYYANCKKLDEAGV